MIKLDSKKVVKIYHRNYYDGFLSGVIEYEGESYWSHCYDENDYQNQKEGFLKDLWWRRYKVFNLTKELWEEENKKHNLWEKAAGKGCSYEDGKRCKYNIDKILLDEFYNKYPPLAQKTLDLDNLEKTCECIGYYEM